MDQRRNKRISVKGKAPFLYPGGVLLFFFLFPFLSVCTAQHTVIKGKVLDSLNREPLPYVNIGFVSSGSGTTTNEEGEFRIESSRPGDSLQIGFLGYQDQTVAVEKGKEQRIEVFLAPEEIQLQDILVKPKDRENPAHPIMRKVIGKKSEHSPSSLSFYEYDVYNKVGIGMGVRDKVVNSWLLKPFRFVFDNIDSSGVKPYLPIFVSETLSRIFYRNEPEAKKEYLKAENSSGLENPSVTKYLGNMYQELDIYQNNVVIFDKSFKSPIANGGFAFYDYFLIDSVESGGMPCYQIRVKPRRKNELTFKGDLFIHRESYAIRRAELEIAEGANINYIRKLSFEQDFAPQKGEQWMLEKNDVNVEAAVLVPHNMRWQEFYAHKTSYYSDFELEKERPDSVYSTTDDIAQVNYGPAAKDSTEKGRAYWEGQRPVPLTKNEEAVFGIIDSVKQMPHYKVARSVIRGYADLGPFEVGPYFALYSFNEVEGDRFRLGGRTDEPLDENLVLSGYAAYGSRDERFKYGGDARYFFNKNPTRDFVGLAYRKDLEQLGMDMDFLQNDNILNTTFRRNPINKLNEVESFQAFATKEWDFGLSTQLQARRRSISPRGALSFERDTEEGGTEEVNGVTTSELSLFTHFGFKERYYTTSYRRINLGSDHPVVDLNYTYGFDDVLGADHGYQKLTGRFSHKVRTGYPGTFRYTLQGGKYWGDLPYPLLELHTGNETYFLNGNAFNMMNLYEFVSDEYISLFFTHHFEGLFFNRIPLLRKLKLREVVSGKALVGSFSDGNRDLMHLPDDLFTIDADGEAWERPYMEVSAGIENIFSLIRVDAVWRLTHLDHPNISPFGVRGTVQFGF